jgi:hypothetical protein
LLGVTYSYLGRGTGFLREPSYFAELVFRVPAWGVKVISRRGGLSRGTTAKCATGCMFKVTVVPDLLLEMLQSLKIDLSNTR